MAVSENIPPPLPPRPITISPKQFQTEYSIDTDTDTKTPLLIPNQILTTYPRPSTILPKPIVIPQTAHTYHGTIHRPFTRATSPILSTLPTPLTTPDFLTFLDTLNTVWLANPYLQAAGQAGNLLSFVPTIEFQLLALGIQTAAEYGSFMVSWVRTRQFLRVANERLFGPRGLRVRVLRTREMLGVVGVEGRGVLELPAVLEDEEGDEVWEGGEGEKVEAKERGTGGKFDPRMRRMEALKEYVAPLVLKERKGPVDGDNWLRRAASMQEKWFADRQNNRLIDRHGKAVRGIGEAEAAEQELLGKMEEVEWAREEARGRAKERMQGPLGESLQGRGIVQDDLAQELKTLDRQMEKLVKEREKKVTKRIQQSERRLQRVEKREARIARKVRWVVITGDDGTQFDNLYEDD
ncbi:uncharacterized protein BO80DRAFT_418533 [Aspergillus ibericus CBS 121593]|uniref:Uncharacterized protein n=1 Tax=Aspergillus ibericus CBS 121593 TaxID=1448316 RepID=A0A395GJH3_9EURO|nr:hypothetical protein BO80DRAFT_418533 [Aspergillus ibericus CBS 121593]RAK95631.1 hypothetical protein BO80DRAFT_418533 [Aspergillus ibericus CBS 121593]